MLNYVQTKSRQGIFFQKPEEKIHLPDGAELVMRNPEERSLKYFCEAQARVRQGQAMDGPYGEWP